MTAQPALLGLFAETSIHAGTGQTFGIIDLPIQREIHTGFPCVYASGVKGALRAKAEDESPRPGWIADVFGPDASGGKASEHAGALAVTDARLLLLPIRSLTGYYKWTTCPAILRRFEQDSRRLLGKSGFTFKDELKPAGDAEALVHAGGGDLFLEEFRFKTVPKHGELDRIIAVIAGLIAGESVDDPSLKSPHPNPLPKGEGENGAAAAPSGSPRFREAREQLQDRLAIVSDDMFTYLSRFGTAVAAHIKIEGGKEVKKEDGTTEWQPSRKTV